MTKRYQDFKFKNEIIFAVFYFSTYDDEGFSNLFIIRQVYPVLTNCKLIQAFSCYLVYISSYKIGQGTALNQIL